MPSEDDGSRTDPLLDQNMITSSHYEPDFDALRSASTRIVVAAGEESEGQMASRGAFAVAERLGTEPVLFPSNQAASSAANTARPVSRTLCGQATRGPGCQHVRGARTNMQLIIEGGSVIAQKRSACIGPAA